MNTSLIHKILIWCYGILLIAGAVMSLLSVPYCAYIFTAGSVLAIAEAFWNAIENRTIELAQARRHRLYFFASLSLGVASWYMLRGSNNWVPFALIWALVVLYLTLRSSGGNKNA